MKNFICEKFCKKEIIEENSLDIDLKIKILESEIDFEWKGILFIGFCIGLIGFVEPIINSKVFDIFIYFFLGFFACMGMVRIQGYKNKIKTYLEKQSKK